MYKQDLALNNQQGLKCHKTTNQPIYKPLHKLKNHLIH